MNFLISGALMFTVFHKHKPALLTSLIDGSALMVIAVCFVTLDLPLSAFASGLSGLIWYILLVQKIIIKRRKRTIEMRDKVTPR